MGKLRVAHVELSLDPALRFILQFAAAIEFDGPRALGGDQKAFQFIVKAAKFSRCLIAFASFLYMALPENAIVLVIDERPSIQALERAQRYLKLPNGRAITGQLHDYKRNGTTTLFAALDLKSGKVVGRHYKRRQRIEFLDFMNKVVADHPDREIHVVLDNLSTHKPKRDMWLKRHKNVHFYFTPTHASWLNQVEIWFSILAAQ